MKWDWTTAAFAELCEPLAVCDCYPRQRLTKILHVARTLGVLPGHVLQIADRMARDPHTGTIRLHQHPMPQPVESAGEPTPSLERQPIPMDLGDRPPSSHGPKCVPAAKPRTEKTRPRQRKKGQR